MVELIALEANPSSDYDFELDKGKQIIKSKPNVINATTKF